MRISLRTRSFAKLTVGLALSSQCVWAQGSVGPSSPDGSPPRGPLPPTFVIMSRAWGLDSQGSIYLTGKVMLDDGTAPVSPVAIECVCNGAARVQGYTDQ